MRIIALVAVVAAGIWAAKTGKLNTRKLKTSRLDRWRGRARDLADGAADDLGKRAEDAIDRVRAHSH